MGCVAIGATGYALREAQTVVFTVVAFHVGLDSHIEDLVFSHQLLIAMALQADLGVEIAVLKTFRVAKWFYGMEIVAVTASG